MHRAIPFAITAALAFAAGFLASRAFPPSVTGSNDAFPSHSNRPHPVGGQAEAHSSSKSGPRTLPFAGEAMDAPDLVAAVTEAIQTPNIVQRIGRLAWISEHIDASNAPLVADTFLSRSSGDERMLGLQFICYGWGAADPSAALEFAETLGSDIRQTAFNGVLSGWVSRDYEVARAWVEQMPAGPLKHSAEHALMNGLVQSDPERAVDEFLANPTRQDPWMLQAALSRLAEIDPTQAAARLAALPAGDTRRQSLSAIAAAWAKRDRVAAMRWVEDLPENREKRDALGTLTRSWAAEDFEGALGWAKAFPTGRRRDHLLQGIFQSAIAHAPEQAIDYVEMLSSTEAQNQMLRQIASGWTGQDEAAARSWAESQTDPAVRKVVWSGVIDSLATRNPASAAEIVDQLPEDLRGDAIQNIAFQWGMRDPANAIEWANTRSDRKAKRASMGTVMSHWVTADPDHALEWFSRVPASEDRDTIVETFVPSLVDQDPRLATEWATSIANAETRLRTLENVAHLWLASDSAAARLWIAQSPLPNETRQRLLSEE